MKAKKLLPGHSTGSDAATSASDATRLLYRESMDAVPVDLDDDFRDLSYYSVEAGFITVAPAVVVS